jgi:hypothetical protein
VSIREIRVSFGSGYARLGFPALPVAIAIDSSNRHNR